MADKKQAVEQTAPVEDLNEMMKVRRDKLETYRSMGIAPFGHRYEVTYHAQDVRDVQDAPWGTHREDPGF